MDLASQLAQIDTIMITLMNKRVVNAFQIPPIASAKGHKAEDWRGKQIWTGYCRVMMEGGSICKVQLINEDDSLFAQSVITVEDYDPFVQRCFDSSRFFALMLVNDNGQKALVGVGFPERNDSFDFIAALDDYKKQARLAKGIVDQSNFKSGPSKDFSLKEGEKISINIPGLTTGKKIEQKSGGGFGGGLKKLAPPPGKTSASQTSNFGAFGGSSNTTMNSGSMFGSAPQINQQPVQQSQDDLLNLGLSFGSGLPQQQQQQPQFGIMNTNSLQSNSSSNAFGLDNDLFGDFNSSTSGQINGAGFGMQIQTQSNVGQSNNNDIGSLLDF
ncbi:adaptin ear-binding coat-associated protein 1 necap-1 [Stylonychia lemnae]|uniref:Adaptin ear-binding coat-associated protein 1 necap-1 n=1 Tax=Stylonychia lemnae TaxID=5949 RepID=A0A078BA42_STYLE|nr:adaptin ear-binding coat-associated protein 1 necap-1 [Stylonychia lemnae]|eukprot:CDW91370.1 adaptin ear-binding coat-associated protein 1 necap-1 [Stylonychia lemnae]